MSQRDIPQKNNIKNKTLSSLHFVVKSGNSFIQNHLKNVIFDKLSKEKLHLKALRRPKLRLCAFRFVLRPQIVTLLCWNFLSHFLRVYAAAYTQVKHDRTGKHTSNTHFNVI